MRKIRDVNTIVLTKCNDCEQLFAELFDVMGARKCICEGCIEKHNYQTCEDCCMPGTDEAFDYGHDVMCNDCVDKHVDSYGDRD